MDHEDLKFKNLKIILDSKIIYKNLYIYNQ